METNAFSQISVLHLPSVSRLLLSACSPDKDLVALISRLGGKDRLSLWKMQGSKKWEVDVGTDQNRSEEIVALAWSPSGQSIALAHDPPRITLHSVQDGREERSLHIQSATPSPRRSHRLTNIWWFQAEKIEKARSIPDIFRRGGVITGSAHSVLKMLPLLDHLSDDAQRTTATDLFAFQGSYTRSTPKTSLPDSISLWPSLYSDPFAASMSSSVEGLDQQCASGTLLESTTDPNLNSYLNVADDQGHLYYFLDGSYPLGPVSFGSGSELSLASLCLVQSRPIFLCHPRIQDEAYGGTDLHPTVIHLPLLEKRTARDLAKLCSTARELVWYTTRVIKEMRAVWFGSNTSSGARELGPKWTRALETRQKEKFGQSDRDPLLDLTCLLVTGRASDALTDFLGSGDQMSERGIQKWENTVVEALIKLRDYSEKRVAPACQRLHIVLEEVKGCSQLPQYAAFDLNAEDIQVCLSLTNIGIFSATWLAAVARRELARFREFIKWLSFETSVLAAPDSPPSPRHDILEVNNYFISGLVVSSIDKWFMGPVPRFTPRDVGVTGDEDSLPQVLKHARRVLDSPASMAWQLNVKQNDLSHLDRNLDALIQELATRCQRLFVRGAGAATRSAIIKPGPGSIREAEGVIKPTDPLPMHERIVGDEAGHLTQYLAVRASSEGRIFLCLSRMRYGHEETERPSQVAVVLLECRLTREGRDAEQDEEGGQEDFDLLQCDFFDDQSVVIVYRIRGHKGSTFLGTVNYNDLEYLTVQHEGHLTLGSREDLIDHAMDLFRKGLLPSAQMPIKRCRELTCCESGAVSLAVNGRAGRRVACLLDSKGTTMEVLDLEGEVEGEGEDEGADPDGDGEEIAA